MNLRQWTTNNKKLQRQIDKDGTGAPAIGKVLGLVWNSECDTLKLSLDKIIQDASTLTKLTKRSVLTITAKLFDPLGWVEPFTVRAKILMQDIWKQNIAWDEELTSTLKNEWKAWINTIKDLQPLELLKTIFNIGLR